MQKISAHRFIANALRALAVLGIVAAAACSSNDVEYTYPEKTGKGGGSNSYSPNGKKNDSLFGPDGLQLFGGGKKDDAGGAGGIGVNSYLWRASLDSIAFMPLA